MRLQSAVIVPVAAAEPVVASYRRDLDRAASWGVPAHVTIVFPFAPGDELTPALVERLARVVARVPAFDLVLDRCAWFGDDVLWLAPVDGAPFRALTAAVVGEFPAWPPYGGAHDDVVPHLTVGERACGSLARLRAAEADVVRRLPVATSVDHALLISGTDQPDSWRTVARLPLSAPYARPA